MAGIDDWLPIFDVGERHETRIAWPPQEALRRALAIPAAPDRFVRFLFRLRGLRPDGSIEHFMATNGFLVLERTATTYVVGLVVQRGPVPLRDATTWRTLTLKRSVKIAADLRTETAPGGARLITETRVVASDLRARVAFRLYWLVVGPLSAMIRRRWVRAAAASGRP
jgi:hypothetical protein